MYVKLNKLAIIPFITSAVTWPFFEVQAGKKFDPLGYQCVDEPRTCVSSGTRTVDGFQVHRDCWEWSYNKTCQYPSKNNCSQYAHCYAVADLRCLLRDKYGNCVNLEKEFCCKSWDPTTVDKDVVRTGFTEKDGKDRLICKGVHCIDGNCFDKSYLTDDDMMDSVSKLSAVSQMKGGGDPNFKLFPGMAESCSKKATNYTNCCSVGVKGWGTSLGAGCTSGEKALMEKRKKNLCIYVGKENKQTMGVTTRVKHHFCCFSNMLNKVIQVEGRKQLRMTFGRGAHPDCRGLTLDEILRLDFDRMDFSEFYVDIVKKLKLPQIGDVGSRLKSSVGNNIRQGDKNPNNKQNKMSGLNTNIKHDGQ